MRLREFEFKAAHRIAPGQRIEGTVMMPEGVHVVHAGARTPDGALCLWAEVSEVELPNVKMQFVILKEGDEIPDDHKYRGHILANPLLFVYQRMPETSPIIVNTD